MKRTILLSLLLLACLGAAARAVFRPTAQLLFSIGTLSPSETVTELFLNRSGPGQCQEQLELQLEPSAGVLVSQDENGLELQSTRAEQVVQGTLQGNCPEEAELSLEIQAESVSEVLPSIVVNAAAPVNEVRFLGLGNFSVAVKVFFPSEDDTLLVTGWQEKSPTLAQSEPTGTYAHDWIALGPTGWQQYWQSSLTWPETPADFQAPQKCHSLSQVFFPLSQESSCLGNSGARTTMQLPLARLWYGWKDGLAAHFLLPATRAPQAGEIRITEVMWAGSFSSTLNYANDEWIELYNTTDEHLSLDTVVAKNARAAGATLYFPVGLRIAPNSYFIIGKPIGETLLARPPDWQTRNLSLSNTEAEIRLETVSGEIIDALPSGSWQAGENTVALFQRSSAQLRHLSLPGNEWSSWSQCARTDEERCWFVTSALWKPNSAQNLASPWQASVL